VLGSERDHYRSRFSMSVGGADTPQREPVDGPALEILNVMKGRGVKKYSKPQEHVAERITRILTDGETVTDHHTRAVRKARRRIRTSRC